MDLNSLLSSDIVKQIAGAAGESTDNTKNVLESALPLLLNGEKDQKKVTSAAKKATGASSSSISNIITAAGPILSGLLANGLDGLDSDGDGKIDIAGIIGTVFSSNSGSSSSSGGLLGGLSGILGGLFGGSSSGTTTAKKKKKKTTKK